MYLEWLSSCQEGSLIPGEGQHRAHSFSVQPFWLKFCATSGKFPLVKLGWGVVRRHVVMRLAPRKCWLITQLPTAFSQIDPTGRVMLLSEMMQVSLQNCQNSFGCSPYQETWHQGFNLKLLQIVIHLGLPQFSIGILFTGLRGLDTPLPSLLVPTCESSGLCFKTVTCQIEHHSLYPTSLSSATSEGQNFTQDCAIL